jgi:hypothetical protein
MPYSVRRTFIAAAVALSGCSSDPTSPPPTTAFFRAVSHQGRALPVLVPGFAGDSVRILDGALHFLSADRLQLNYTLLWGQRPQRDSLQLQMVAEGDSASYRIICNDTPNSLAICIEAGFVGPKFVDAPEWTLGSVGFPFPKGAVRFVRILPD